MGTFHENLVASFTNFKNKFLKANGKDFHFAYDSTTQKYGYTIDGTFYPFKTVQASKTVTAGTSVQTVTPDSGYDGIGSITVNPTPSQSKSASPSVSAQTITPDSGKLLSSVSVSAITPNLSEDSRYQHEVNNSTPTLIGDAGFFTTVYDRVSKTNLGNYFEIRFNGSKNKSNINMTAGWMSSNTLLALPSQTKTITASRSQQTVTPDSNKVLQSVIVNKYPDASDTYGTITSNGTHDMGATNDYRYVSVNVPNTALTVKTATFTKNGSMVEIRIPDAYPNTIAYIDSSGGNIVIVSSGVTNVDGSSVSAGFPKPLKVISSYWHLYLSGVDSATVYYVGK